MFAKLGNAEASSRRHNSLGFIADRGAAILYPTDAGGLKRSGFAFLGPDKRTNPLKSGTRHCGLLEGLGNLSAP
jgi:hypothetical protein